MTDSLVPQTVSVLSLGGTIAMTNTGTESAGVVPTLDATALLAALSGLARRLIEL